MLRPMKLEGALKLYIALYVAAFALTFFTSIPMLLHVAPKSECLLFAPPPPIKYGTPGGCMVCGILPLLTALGALALIFIHWLQLRKLREHIKLPEMTSDEFRAGFKKTFWKMIILHCIVAGFAVTVACILTSGYATSCHNLYLEIEKTVRARLEHTPLQNRGQQNAHEVFADDHTLNRYTVDNQDFLGRNKYEQSITCRAIFTDQKLHFDLKKSHGRDSITSQYYGFWNINNNDLADIGNFRHIAFRDNLYLELSLAGAWIGLLIWSIMLVLMLKERHHLKAFITDESMWGGSNYGEGSVRSGRSRKSSAMSQGRLMSPIDFENMEKMSEYSRTSRASRSSRGTSYKDMGRKKSANGSNSYKSMGASRSTRESVAPSQLTVSRLEQVPQVDSGYTVKRLLNMDLNNSGVEENGSQQPPVARQSRQHNSRHVEEGNMSVYSTVTGAEFGPVIAKMGNRNSSAGRKSTGGGLGLVDYFGPPVSQQPVQPVEPDRKSRNTIESDMM